jgi:hypothetical protein
MGRWADGWVTELYAEVVEADDVVGDFNGREGLKDWIGCKKSAILSFIAIEVENKFH